MKACMTAVGSGKPVFIDNGTADRISKMNIEVYRTILSDSFSQLDQTVLHSSNG